MRTIIQCPRDGKGGQGRNHSSRNILTWEILHGSKTRPSSPAPVRHVVSYSLNHSTLTIVSLEEGDNSKVKGRFSRRREKEPGKGSKLICPKPTGSRGRQSSFFPPCSGWDAQPPMEPGWWDWPRGLWWVSSPEAMLSLLLHKDLGACFLKNSNLCCESTSEF